MTHSMRMRTCTRTRIPHTLFRAAEVEAHIITGILFQQKSSNSIRISVHKCKWPTHTTWIGDQRFYGTFTRFFKEDLKVSINWDLDPGLDSDTIQSELPLLSLLLAAC